MSERIKYVLGAIVIAFFLLNSAYALFAPVRWIRAPWSLSTTFRLDDSSATENRWQIRLYGIVFIIVSLWLADVLYPGQLSPRLFEISILTIVLGVGIGTSLAFVSPKCFGPTRWMLFRSAAPFLDSRGGTIVIRLIAALIALGCAVFIWTASAKINHR